jgi:hypothetical protein
MRTSQRFFALPRTLFPSASPPSSEDSEVIELVNKRAETKRPNAQQLTLLGPGVAAREPERTVHVDPTLFEASPAPLQIVPERTPRTSTDTPARKHKKPRLSIVPAPKSEPVDPKWETYEKIGLGPSTQKSAATRSLAKLIVSTYRLLGFAILSLIVFVLIAYIATTLFYYMNHTWMSPIAVSPSDEKVVTARNALLAAQDQRDRTAAELAQTDRVIAADKAFQGEFAKAIRGDRDDRAAALGRLKELAVSAASTRQEIRSTNEQYAKQSQDQMAKEYEAGLIDRNAALNGKYQVAQIAGANLSLAERQADYEARATELAAQTRALDAISSGKTANGLTYDVLKIKRDFETSRLELAKALGDREVLKASLARQDQTITDLKQGAWLRALHDKATVALVPYKNLDNIKAGTPIYACRAGFLVCRQVGTVLEVLRGEITFKHPHRDQMLRGQMVELRMTDADAATDDVMFVGSRPLGI